MNKLTTLMLTSVILTACSSGGGSKNNESPPPVTEQNSAVNTTSESSKSNTSETQVKLSSHPSSPSANSENQPITPQADLENTKYAIDKNDFQKGELNKESVMYGNKKIAELSGYNRQYSFNGALQKVEEAEFGEIVVDGTVMLIINKIKGGVGGLSGWVLSKTLGSFYNTTKDPERDIFYFGYETPPSNIPKQGITTYRGNASRYDNFNYSVENVGDSELIADFGKKTIKGKLDMNYPRRNITLNETAIVGNGFNGKAVTEGNIPFLITREGTYEGKFYGPNAEEVAGKATFEESLKDLNTSFSAERVNN